MSLLQKLNRHREHLGFSEWQVVLQNCHLIMLVGEADFQRGLKSTEDVIRNLKSGFIFIHRDSAAKLRMRRDRDAGHNGFRIAAMVEKRNALAVLNEEREIISTEADALDESLQEMREGLAGLREELASDISRLSALREIVYDKAAHEVLGEAGNLPHLSDVITVPSEYEKAIEAALRELVGGLVVQRVHAHAHVWAAGRAEPS